ncbi:MAG TPA: Hsp20/alpha crystallin family protein [Oculatellaceae cyanobacterium]
MTLNKIVPWGRKQVPIRRTDEYNPPSLWSDFGDPLNDLDRMFERFLNLSPLLSRGLGQEFSPSLDVHETDKEFQINVEVPGMNEKDIDISMSRDTLTISGEKREEKEENAKGVYRMERRYGSFTRSIPLPENCVDTEKAEASFKNGVLTIKLPKAAEYKETVKKIPVTTSKPDGNSNS